MRSFLHPVRPGFRGLASVVMAAVALGLAIPVAASAAAFTAHLTAPNHQPIANKRWPITVTVTRGRAKLSGSVRYEFAFNGQVVSHQPGHKFTGGVYRDKLLFPKKAVGYTLSLRVIVTTSYGTVDLPWWIKARA